MAAAAQPHITASRQVTLELRSCSALTVVFQPVSVGSRAVCSDWQGVREQRP